MMHNVKAAAFPAACESAGKKIAYVSNVLLPARRFEEYARLMEQVLAEDVHYIDPVHDIRGRSEVLSMLTRYLPRVSNDKFQFSLVHEDPSQLIWKWTIALRIRFTPFEFVIHGLVHARVEAGRIVYQREYYDPMESIGVIPLLGPLYRLILRLG